MLNVILLAAIALNFGENVSGLIPTTSLKILRKCANGGIPPACREPSQPPHGPCHRKVCKGAASRCVEHRGNATCICLNETEIYPNCHLCGEVDCEANNGFCTRFDDGRRSGCVCKHGSKGIFPHCKEKKEADSCTESEKEQCGKNDAECFVKNGNAICVCIDSSKLYPWCQATPTPVCNKTCEGGMCIRDRENETSKCICLNGARNYPECKHHPCDELNCEANDGYCVHVSKTKNGTFECFCSNGARNYPECKDPCDELNCEANGGFCVHFNAEVACVKDGRVVKDVKK